LLPALPTQPMIELQTRRQHYSISKLTNAKNNEVLKNLEKAYFEKKDPM